MASDGSRRKLVEIDEATWIALVDLGRDRMSTFQELCDEALRDLLRKHNRPTTLKAALKSSLRQVPANDATTRKKRPPK